METKFNLGVSDTRELDCIYLWNRDVGLKFNIHFDRYIIYNMDNLLSSFIEQERSLFSI